MNHWSEKVARVCYDYIKSQNGGMSEAAMENMAEMIRLSAPESPQHLKNIHLLTHDACENGVWGTNGTAVAKDIELRFSCFGVSLRPDGTYSLSDYSG